LSKRARTRIVPDELVVDRIDHAIARVARLVGEAQLHRHLGAVFFAADVLQVGLLIGIERGVDR